MHDYQEMAAYLRDSHLKFTRGNHENVQFRQESNMQTEVTIKYEKAKSSRTFGSLKIGEFFQWGDRLYIKLGPYNEMSYKYRGVQVGGVERNDGIWDTISFRSDHVVIIPKAVKIRVITDEGE